MLLNCGVGEDSWESVGWQGDPTSPSERKSDLNIHWKDWCWGWNSNTLAMWCEELTHLKRPWFWERLKAGREGDDKGWDGWMASPTQWTWVWVTLGVGDGQGGLVCFIPWGCKDLDMTGQLNWTELLDKTPESPLDCREIQPVNPKGNQPWLVIGRIHAEAPIPWPPNAKSWFIRKDLDAGADWRQEEKGMTEDEMIGWYHQLDGHEFE